jgi:ABC-type transport system involved in cytochrome c biogenesis permease subunit
MKQTIQKKGVFYFMKQYIFYFLLMLLIFTGGTLTKKLIPETENRKPFQLYLLRASVSVIPMAILAMLLYLVMF